MKDHPRSLDEQIRKAIDEGVFNDLPGKGKPIDLRENPFEDPSWRMANRMLRANGFSLPWIETRKEIEADYLQAVRELKRSWLWRESKHNDPSSAMDIEREWCQAAERFKAKILDLNKRIFNYNLVTPSNQFIIRRIIWEREIDRITSASD